MKISLNWLKNYIDTDLTPEQIADLLTSTGLEVELIEHYEQIPGMLENVVIGEVLEKTKHPGADKLSLTKVNVGNEVLSIVCGAPNVAQGQKVVVAKLGAKLRFSDGKEIEITKAKIRGEESFGMICAEDELGLGNSHDGIMVLAADAVIGQEAATYFRLQKDVVFHIGLTPNRSDAFSHIGVARDLAAAISFRQNKPVSVKLPEIKKLNAGSISGWSVEIDNPESCPRYCALFIENIEVKESPEWLIQALRSIGQKPINNIVDVTNFILHEMGQPLHAFDADKIMGKKVVVKTFPKNTEFVTLDNQKRKLNDFDLMICNEKEPMCIAGVFGGAHSGVSNNTKNVLLESATFNPVQIRKTSYSHMLRTEAAQHYEKGSDIEINAFALERAALLIEMVSGGKASAQYIDNYPAKKESNHISYQFSKVNKLIGAEISAKQIEKILQSLDFSFTKIDGDNFEVSVPSYRVEVTRPADLVEEVLRIYGLNQIPIPQAIRSSIQTINDSHSLEQKLRDTLKGLSFNEIMTNAISKSVYYTDDELSNMIRLMNSQTSELNVLRKTALYEGLEVMAHNINRKQSDLKLFELTKVYTPASEKKKLYLYAAGFINEPNWLQTKQNANELYLKSIVQLLLQRAGLEQFEISETQDKHLENAVSIGIKNTEVAHMGKLNNKTATVFDIKQDVFIAVIDMEKLNDLVKNQKIRYEVVSRFPLVKRDFALVLDENISFIEVSHVVKKSLSPWLEDINLFDVYRGDKIASGKKSYAISVGLRSKEKTLSDKEIESSVKKLIHNLEKELNAHLRE